MLGTPACGSSVRTENKQIRVCIRGICGLLGSRLAAALKRHPDIEVVSGVAKKDQTLDRLRTLSKYLSASEHSPIFLPAKKMYIHYDPNLTKKLNEELTNEGIPISFISCDLAKDMEKIAADCDVVMDTTGSGASKRWRENDKKLKIPVILQSGEYPEGRIIAPPLMGNKMGGNLYRQGDCIQSALAPVLAACMNEVHHIRMTVRMQYSERLDDYTIGQRIRATYIPEEERAKLEKNFSDLFGDLIEVESLTQVPGVEYYVVTLVLELKTQLSPRELGEMLRNKARIFCAPELSSTYEIDHQLREPLQTINQDIAPVVVFATDLTSSAKQAKLRMNVAIAYRYITVLPNIDSIRILGNGMPAEEAMQLTDRYMGFVRSK